MKIITHIRKGTKFSILNRQVHQYLIIRNQSFSVTLNGNGLYVNTNFLARILTYTFDENEN